MWILREIEVSLALILWDPLMWILREIEASPARILWEIALPLPACLPPAPVNQRHSMKRRLRLAMFASVFANNAVQSLLNACPKTQSA